MEKFPNNFRCVLCLYTVDLNMEIYLLDTRLDLVWIVNTVKCLKQREIAFINMKLVYKILIQRQINDKF